MDTPFPTLGIAPLNRALPFPTLGIAPLIQGGMMDTPFPPWETGPVILLEEYFERQFEALLMVAIPKALVVSSETR
jgi:hypothetical protein